MAEGGSATATRGQSTGSHVFAEFESLEGLNAPIRTSGRIKYTSIGVCRRYIALGASTGGLYIFHRESLKYLQVLSNKEGAITKVAFAPNDNLVGFATSLGFVIAWELNLDKRDQPERQVVSTAHRNVQVTCLQWDSASVRLFSGDNKGRVTQTNADARKASGFFKMPTEILLTIESAIVQLDFADEKVLVSAQAKCIICDTDKKQSYTVGKKPRDGQFGGCFLQRPGIEFPSIYTGRPGSRVWEANIVGQVQATHQFKQLLAVPPLPVVGPSKHPVFVDEQKPQSFNFPVLLPMGSRFLLTWTDKGVFVFDPLAVDVVMWTADIKGIVDAGSFKGQLYCLQENGRLHRYFLLSIERCIAKLFGQSLWEQCAQLCARFSPKVTHIRARRHIPVTLLKELNYQLLDHTKDLDLVEQIDDLVDHVQSASPGSWSTTSSRRSSLESCDSVRLESGIYLIRNRFDRNDSEDSFDDVPMQGGDGAIGEVSLMVPTDPVLRVTGAEHGDKQNDLSDDDFFPSAVHTVISKVTTFFGSNEDVTEHDGTSQETRSQSSLGEVIQVDSTRDTLDSQVILESASKDPLNTMQLTLQSQLTSDRLESSLQTEPNNNSTSEYVDTLENSTNSETTSDWQDVELEEQETTHVNVLDQSAVVSQSTEPDRTDTTQGEDPLLQGEDTSLNRPMHLEQLEDHKLAACSGPGITPSPELAPGLSIAHWNQYPGHEREFEESYQSSILESSVDSDAVSQDSISVSDISVATSPGKESAPFSQSNSVPIHTSASMSALATSHSYGASPPSLPQASVEHPPMRRAMSVPSNVAEAEIGAVVVRRRLSSSGKSKDKKKKKKRKSRIADIGELQVKSADPQPDEALTEDFSMADTSYKPTLSSSQNSSPVRRSPIRSMSTPSIQFPPSQSTPASMPYSPKITESSSTSYSSKIKESTASPGPMPPQPQRPLPTARDSAPRIRNQTRTSSWDNSSSSSAWQSQASGMMPISSTSLAFVDLASSPQVLNLPSVSDSISAMKESLSSTLTNAKSFLLNKMDSKDELHHPVSSPATFNNFFPEEDHSRAERFQDLVQVGKEQQVHPAARGLVAATSVARSKLEDPSILYSPHESRKVLEEWVSHLHAAVHELYTEKYHKSQPNSTAAKAGDTTPDLPKSSKQLENESIGRGGHLQGDQRGHENESIDGGGHLQIDQRGQGDVPEPTAKTDSVCSEEPSGTESVSSEILKDMEEKGTSVETTSTAVPSVRRSLGLMSGEDLAQNEQDTKQSPPPNKSHKTSSFGFLEKLGKGAHSMEIFDEHRKTKEQIEPKVENEDAQNEDELKMEAVPSVLEVQDNCGDTVVANGHLPSAKQNDKNIPNKPNRSASDVELTDLCYTAPEEEVIEKQTFCIKDPFSLPSEIHQEIGELVVMCFEMGVYGNLKKDLRREVDLSKECELRTESDMDNTKLRTKPDFEIGDPSSEVEGQSENMNNSIQPGSPFHVAKHLLPSNQSEQPESDIQVEETLPVAIETESTVATETDLDKVAAGFIKEYFHFLDVNKLRAVLCVREDQRKYSFEALIQCLLEKYKANSQLIMIDEAAEDVGIDHLKTVAQKSPGLELCFATRICEKSPEGGIKYMIMTHPKLKTWEVLDIISSRNERPAAGFLAYVTGVMDITPATKRDELLRKICKETSIRLSLFQFALSHNAPLRGDVLCSCGEMPRPGSHRKEWPQKDLISRMMKQETSLEIKQQMLKHCQQFGYWHAVLVLLQELNERPRALRLVVQLADIEILTANKNKDIGIKVKNLDEWKLILDNITRLIPDQSGNRIEQLNCVECNSIVWPTNMKSNKPSDWSDGICITPEEPECDWSASVDSNPDWLSSAMTSFKERSDWLPTITWESIAQLLVRSVGAQLGVKLLSEVKIPEKALSRQFHQACIMSAILEKGQSTLNHAMLERVDTYLWSKRPTSLAPSLYQLVKNETRQAVARQPGEPATLEEQMELLGSFSTPEGDYHFLEEPDCHWGIHINVSRNCSVCGSPFYTSLPMAVQGVTVFTCGHAFHKLCVPEKACVLCYENKLSSTTQLQQGNK